MILRALYSVHIKEFHLFYDPYNPTVQESWVYNPYGCVSAGLFQIFGLIFGQIILLAMAFDRLLAVCHLLHIRMLGGSIATTIFGLYISTVFVIKRFVKINDMSTSIVLQRQRRVFVSISLILLFYAIFWCLPLSFVLITNYVPPFKPYLGQNSIFISLCAGMNSCVGIFVYLAKHHELRRYFLKICLICIRTTPEDSRDLFSKNMITYSHRKNVTFDRNDL